MADSYIIKYANSWGDWGDNGFGTMKLGSIGSGGFAYRQVTDAP